MITTIVRIMQAKINRKKKEDGEISYLVSISKRNFQVSEERIKNQAMAKKKKMNKKMNKKMDKSRK